MMRHRDTPKSRGFGPVIDKRIIEGFLVDKPGTLQALEQEGFDSRWHFAARPPVVWKAGV